MKKTLIVLLFLLFHALYGANSDDIVIQYINKQSAIYAKIKDLNASEVKLKSFQNELEENQKSFFNTVMNEKEKILSLPISNQSSIKALQKSIKKNSKEKRLDAVHLDTLKLKYYQSLENFFELIRDTITSTYMATKKEFNEELDRITLKNKNAMTSEEDFSKLYENVLYDEEEIVANINKYNDKLNYLIAINNDMRKYILTYQDTFYKSEIYTTFGLDSTGVWIAKLSFAKKLDTILKPIGLDTTKLVMIILIIFWALLLSTLYYWIVHLILKYFKLDTDDTLYIIKEFQNTIRLFIIVFGIDMISDIVLGVGANVDESRKFFITTYIILLTYLVHKIIYTISVIKINSFNQQNKSYRTEIINLVVKLINFIVFLIGLLLVLKIYEVELTAILSGLGIGSLAIAFAARDTLANFLGSISILLDNLFSQGDWIKVGKDEGTVVEIGIRSTTIRTFDNALISVPNFIIANNSVANWSKRIMGRRIKMYLGVTYNSNFDDIKKAIEDIKEMLLDHPDIASNKTQFKTHKEKSLRLISEEDARGVKTTLLVSLDSFGDSSINIMVYCFSKSVNWIDYLEVKQDIMFKIADIFKNNHLEFAFPSVSLYMPEAGQSHIIDEGQNEQ